MNKLFPLLLLFLCPAIASSQGTAEKRPVLVAAHRGGYANDRAEAAPENSVANVAVAVRKGFDLYETDIQRTKDGVFVIVHDETIARETTGEGRVSDLTLSDLKALQKRYRDGSVSPEKVATLEELLLAGKGRILFKADLKPGLVEHFDALAALLHRLDLVEGVFIRCSEKEAAVIGRLYERGTLPLELMVKVGSAARVKEIAARFSPKTIQINLEEGLPLTSPQAEAIKAAVALGLRVEAHCYDDPVFWAELAQAGVRIFHTTKPEETLAWLTAQGWR